jgi:predicted transcriptional regulator
MGPRAGDGIFRGALELRGLPQTVVVDRSGRIAFVHVGAMTHSDVHDTILPLIITLRDRAP